LLSSCDGHVHRTREAATVDGRLLWSTLSLFRCVVFLDCSIGRSVA